MGREKNTRKTKEDEDDFVIDEEALSDISRDAKKLKEDLKHCMLERKEYLEGWQRSRADCANIKKDHEEERKRIAERTKEGLAQELLPVMDSFEMAFSQKDVWEKVDKTWRQGMENIHGQLASVLSRLGVVSYAEEGDTFDEARHHSVEQVEVSDKEKEGKVVSVLQKGYMLGDAVIRAAQVKVGIHKENK